MSGLLVIEDGAIDRYIMESSLHLHQLFPVRRFINDAESAIEEIEKNRLDADALPDLIFLDLMMDDFNGLDFLERFNLLLDQIPKPIPIFVFTCSINPDDRSEAGSYFFVKGFYDKPVNAEVLNKIELAFRTVSY